MLSTSLDARLRGFILRLDEFSLDVEVATTGSDEKLEFRVGHLLKRSHGHMHLLLFTPTRARLHPEDHARYVFFHGGQMKQRLRNLRGRLDGPTIQFVPEMLT